MADPKLLFGNLAPAAQSIINPIQDTATFVARRDSKYFV